MKTSSSYKVSDQELEKSYWVITHASLIRLWTLRLFIILDILLVVSVIVPFSFFVIFALSRGPNIVEPLRALANNAFPPSSLESPTFRTSGMIDRGSGSYDLYALIENTQEQWRVDAEVIFSIRGSDLAPVRVTLFPGDRRYVLSTGVANTDARELRVRLEELAWQRLDGRALRMLSSRDHVRVSDVSIITGSSNQDAPSGTAARFILENKSVYNLYDFRVSVVFMHGTTPVAVSTLPVFELRRNGSTQLEARWNYEFATTGQEIMLDIDVLDTAHATPAL